MRAEVGTTATFLILPQGARACGMGQAFVAVADDATGPHYNPAGPALRPWQESCLPWPVEAHLSHSPWMPVFDLDDLYLRYSSVTQNIPRVGTLVVGSTYLHVGEVMGTDENNNETGAFAIADMAISFNYSARLTPSVSVGATFKDIASQLSSGCATTASAWDFGVLYRPLSHTNTGNSISFHGPSFGLGLANCGRDMRYGIGTGDLLPRLLRIGLAQEILYARCARLLVSTEVNKIMVNHNEGTLAEELRESKRCIGAELALVAPLGRILGLPAHRVVLSSAFRGGYYHDREASNVPRGRTAGLGVGLSVTYRQGLAPLHTQVDYATIEPPEDLGVTHTRVYSFSMAL
ncbi:PorV/PorQ family protein [Candidatus Fermentibacteria bacterium]|nr:PorV/PorQ family protein [Candidatus Fermentibacteria bacterium]